MTILITGLGGTVAPVVAERLREQGHYVQGWDRTAVPIDDRATVHRFVKQAKPDWCFHVATGDPQWAAWIAESCTEQQITMIFTGSVSVFSTAQNGPFSPEVIPEPNDDYGRYKLQCEHLVRQANPNAIIARLGWQIGNTFTGNQMLAWLAQQAQDNGKLTPSRAWFPSCAFLEDTADALIALAVHGTGGLYHLEGNPGLSFADIATKLNQKHQAGWVIEPNEDFVWDNRMQDSRLSLPPISERLMSA